jgi:dihydropyrimidinase
MYEVIKFKGNADTVLSRGEVIVQGNKFLGKPGRGNYVKRDTYAGAWG